MEQREVGAVILAAGFSSRMGAFKPLLPLGQASAVETAVNRFIQAGIRNIRVVTGHGAKELQPVLAKLPVIAVHNPDYARGMFSTVQTGIASLPESVGACFVLPVDTPLIRSQSLRALQQAFCQQDAAVVYPVVDGRRGHPPLIGRECFKTILGSAGEGGLRAVLARFDSRALEVKLDDPGLLMDMDTPADYQRLLDYQRSGSMSETGGNGVLAGETESVCPCCLRKLPARRMAYGQEIYLEKNCPEHGPFRTLVWQGPPDYHSWRVERTPSAPQKVQVQNANGCPFDCGLCPAHRQQSCCVLLEVTSRCNLQCPVCFAAAGTEQHDPDRETVRGWYQSLIDCGGPFNIQLSGGEPTLRDDLMDLIRDGKERGFPFIQLNTNGLRLAAEPDYVCRLKDAGLDCVFLQFDGVTDTVYQSLRGRPLLQEKMTVLDICAELNLGVVLVPTLVPGINERQIGDILRLALDHLPTVRGVHFQPISYFGRYPQAPPPLRLTLPQVLREIENQTGGQMRLADFRPPGGEHSHCSFHGQFTRRLDGTLQAWSGSRGCGCGSDNGARQSREFVARQWAAPQIAACDGNGPGRMGTDSLDEFLERVKNYTLAVSAMAFQDADNLDLERLRECYIHVVSPDGRLIPFCAYNLTDRQGKSLYRGRI